MPMDRFRTLIFLLLCFVSQHLSAASLPSLDLSSLDSSIAVRPRCDAKVERRLNALKQQLSFAGGDRRKRLRLLNEIYSTYYTYQFDSALVYIKLCYAEAVTCHDKPAAVRAQLNKAELLATGGFYNAAESILDSYRVQDLPVSLRYSYAIAAYWTYVYWSAFTMDTEFSTRMDSLRMQNLNLALQYVAKGSANWYYLKGERSYFLGEHPAKTISYYKKCLTRLKGYGRLYSQATFAIARSYRLLHRDDMYGYWLLASSMSDLLASVKENAALQDLAMFLFHQNSDNATLAHHYLLVAMDDAAFYNNKLRKLEISNRLPPIVNAYLQQLQRQRFFLWSIVALAVLLAAGAFLLFLLSRRRNAQLHLSQKLLEHKNSQLHVANERLQDVNGELSHVNGLLLDANRKREKYLRLFVDICAFTMERITSYRNLVKLKIKAKQTEDLLRTLNSDRILNHDMAQFYLQFDKAFLGLYPHFVDDFAKLLQPEYQVSLNKDGSLTTELRIFAFIRLGVTESSEIATLLSYSPHTIYNYRSAMKGRAIDKDHFEENVRNLCKLD